MKSLIALTLIDIACWGTGISYAHQAELLRAQQQEKVYKVELTATQVNVVVNGLKKLPYEESAELINNVVRQVQIQVKPEPLPSPDTLKKKK